MRMHSATAVLLLAAALGASCGSGPTEPATEGPHSDGPGHDHATHGGDEGDIIRLTPKQLEAAGVTFATAGLGRIDFGTSLLGVVQPNGNRVAHITPRFPGIVREVRANIGDLVRKGQVLAVIESSESLAPYDIKTMTDGTIIEKDLVPGEAVGREKPAFVITDLGTVWIDLSVYQIDLNRVKVGSPIRVSAGERLSADGVISYVTPGMDPATRTATARVVLPNPGGRWRPGMFVSARVLNDVAATVAVPAAALQTVAGKPTVFVQTPEGIEPRVVTPGRRGEQLVEIVSGLKPGEQYAAANTFILKAELGKAGAEHAH